MVQGHPTFFVQLPEAEMIEFITMVGDRWFAGDAHGAVWHFDADTGRVHWHVAAPPDGRLAPLPDGQHVLQFAVNGAVSRIDVRTGHETLLTQWPARLATIKSALPSPCGRWVYVCTVQLEEAFHLIYGDYDEQREFGSLWEVASHRVHWSEHHHYRREPVRFSPDGSCLLSPFGLEGIGTMTWIACESLQKGAVMPSERWLRHPQISQDTRRAYHLSTDEKSLAVTELDADRMPPERILAQGPHPIVPIALSAHERYVVTAEAEYLRLRATTDGSVIAPPLPLNGMTPTTAAWLPGTEALLVGGADGRLARFELSDRKLVGP